MSEPRDVNGLVRSAVAGDVLAARGLEAYANDEIQSIGSAAGDLTLTCAAVARVLFDFQAGRVDASDVMRWAYFVQKGYVPGRSGPTKALPINYEPENEDSIAEVIGRLTELGDLIDGIVSREELRRLLGLVQH